MERLAAVHQVPWFLSPRTFFVHKKFSLTISKVQYLFIHTIKHKWKFMFHEPGQWILCKNPDWAKNNQCMLLVFVKSNFNIWIA
jgi:hypothetical protein